MSLDIRLLGPLEVAVDGRPVWLAGRLRSVLAVLAMSAGRTVPVERIADALWSQGELPGNPRASVQTYVARLRGLLGAGLIGTEPAGYLLRAGPGGVDASRFVALLDEAAAASEPSRERARLAEALRLWRGRPFEGVESVWLRDTLAPRLTERYLAAVERRIDLDLAGGAPGDLVAELTELTSRHPLREPLWSRLIEVLQRSGRQAEALERYETIRRRLAKELGTDPGPGLRAMHTALLAGQRPELAGQRPEPAGQRPEPAGQRPELAGQRPEPAGQRPELAGQRPEPAGQQKPAPAAVVPRQLPADIVAFTPREEALSTMDGALRDAVGMVIVAIGGAGGIGKTTLAVHWAHRVAERFPDGQLYANLRGFDLSGTPRPPAEVVRGFLDALRVPPHEVPAEHEVQVALYRSLLAGKRMLVVLDNARNAEQVRPLLPGSAGCLVVVTSRDRLSGLVAVEGAQPLALDVLSPAEARGMLAHRLGAQRVGADPEATGRIIARCAGLPLALAIVAARAALRPDLALQAVAQQLDNGAKELDAFADADPVSDVRTVFSWSYRTLSPPAARLFRLLGGHPGPDVSTAAAASLAGVPPHEAGELLAELAGAHLLTGHGHDRYWNHDLLHAYAAERAQEVDTQADRRAAAQRVLAHYLHTAHRAARLLDPNRDLAVPAEELPGVSITGLSDRDAAMAWLDTEHRCLQKVIEWAGSAGFDSIVCRLTTILVGYLDLRAHWHDAMNSQLTALAAARRLGDAAEEARVRGRLSRAYTMLHRHDEARAELQRALEISGELGDLQGQALAHHHLAFMFGRQGRYREALDHVGQELDLARAAGYRRMEAMALNGTGWFHARLGELDLAAGYCRAALDIHDELGNRYGEASTWDSLGYIRHQQGLHREAVECYERSAALYHGLGDDFCMAETLIRLGDTRVATGDAASARAVWQEAARLLTALGRAEASQAEARLEGLESEIASG
ncbi:MAG TPA: BTAD domain-containing putative transcriptional regulator [Candidatus Limnocylindrales bacterium]